MTGQQQHLQSLAEESLETFDLIAETAKQKLAESSGGTPESFASINTITSVGAVNNLRNISEENREGYRVLQEEPAISRVVAEDENGNIHTYYISRKSSLALGGKANLASYNSDIGRLASSTIGEDVNIHINKTVRTFIVQEKVIFHPELSNNGWDSTHNVFKHVDLGTLSIESFLQLLAREGFDVKDELEALLSGGATPAGFTEGLTHQIRTAMALRDQPILDEFQSDIFRLPIDSQLIILGPPGTGKTTTLIKRLGQKLDIESLDDDERSIAADDPKGYPHKSSWLVFTPSDLLKHYVKEAFNREQVPASDERIKTWDIHRNDIARNVLGILKSNITNGRYIHKPGITNLIEEVMHDPREWFDAFARYHKQRVFTQLSQGLSIASSASVDINRDLISKLSAIMEGKNPDNLIGIYTSLSSLETDIVRDVAASKEATDKLIRKELMRQFNKNRQFLDQLASFLDGLQQEDDEDEDDGQFDDDLTDEQTIQTQTNAQKAEKAYVSCIKNLSRYKFLKKSIPKKGKTTQVRDWLGDRLPAEDVLIDIGQGITLQNGLRRFQNAFRRYVREVPSSYSVFRKHLYKEKQYYEQLPENVRHIDFMELDALVLLMLKNARELLVQNFVSLHVDEQRFYMLSQLAGQFRNQVLVDEATDFSVLQLACMENLTQLKSRSFFACGDFNQRVTGHGIRTLGQLDWVSKRIENKIITTVYRQSKKLNNFAGKLIEALEGDLTTLGSLPDGSVHAGVSPVLLENTPDIQTIAAWLAERIGEIEKILQQKMPTVAVLVNSEEDVKPMADELSAQLENINLRAIPCLEGQALGEGTDVRVFDVQHIKGLEFEAVFFAGVDELSKQMPDLFGRYLYVGTTRAATYLGLTCTTDLPNNLDCLRELFIQHWG